VDQVPGDGPTFESEFKRLFGRAYAIARRLTGDPSLSEDLAAEAMARTCLHWKRVRNYEFRDAYVARIVTNLVIAAAKRRRFEEAPTAVVDPSDGVVLRVALLGAIEQLPRRQREIVALRYLADLSVDDVASTLKVTNGSVKKSLARALEKLRNELGPELAVTKERVA
jgi:RNA polymerase sigma factor (sigma-70 family)